jgi:hypothetical protein
VVSSTLPNDCGVLELRDAEGRELVSGCIINGTGNIDGTVLPSSGRYTVAVDPRDELTGEATLRVFSTPDQVRPITVGGEATATVAAPGAVARLEFAGTEGQTVSVDVVSTNLANDCGVLELLAPGGRVVTSGCIINGDGDIAPTVLPATGVYSILVDPRDNITGEARVRLQG